MNLHKNLLEGSSSDLEFRWNPIEKRDNSRNHWENITDGFVNQGWRNDKTIEHWRCDRLRYDTRLRLNQLNDEISAEWKWWTFTEDSMLQ